MDGFIHTIIDGITYDLLKRLSWEVVMIAAANILVAAIFKRLRALREIAIYWASMLVILTGLFQIIGSRPQEPDFKPNIDDVKIGSNPGAHATFAIITMTIINAGNMQSIGKDWNVKTLVNHNPLVSQLPLPLPDTISLNTANGVPTMPNTLIYHLKEDNLLEKMTNPIQPGGLIRGTIFILFDKIDMDVFKLGAEFTVTFQDALARKYAATTTLVPRVETTPILPPGLHTESVCPIPPGSIIPVIPAPSVMPQTIPAPIPIPAKKKTL